MAEQLQRNIPVTAVHIGPASPTVNTGAKLEQCFVNYKQGLEEKYQPGKINSR
jgi:hypothetical protein